MPFRMPKLCDSCVFYQGREDAFQQEETCDAYPDGIPYEILYLGADHFSGQEPLYSMDIGAEDELATWTDTWYTTDDDGGVAQGIEGIPGAVAEG